MDKWVKRAWWAILGIILVIAVIKFMLPVNSPVKVEQAQSNREIVVYMTGAVNNPGLLKLPIDARLDDALKKCGVTYQADIEVLNLAQKLKDGQKIVVPYKPESQILANASSVNPTINGVSASTAGSSGKIVSAVDSRVNINSAGVSELDTIPGIGPTIAQRIIDYRQQHGLFSSVDEIQEVSGIGPKTYEKMAEYITIGR